MFVGGTGWGNDLVDFQINGWLGRKTCCNRIFVQPTVSTSRPSTARMGPPVHPRVAGGRSRSAIASNVVRCSQTRTSKVRFSDDASVVSHKPVPVLQRDLPTGRYLIRSMAATFSRSPASDLGLRLGVVPLPFKFAAENRNKCELRVRSKREIFKLLTIKSLLRY